MGAAVAITRLDLTASELRGGAKGALRRGGCWHLRLFWKARTAGGQRRVEGWIARL
jgi:hypothetical protein